MGPKHCFSDLFSMYSSKTDLTKDNSNNDSDTVTFHDALSDNDDSDMLLEDLEYD